MRLNRYFLPATLLTCAILVGGCAGDFGLQPDALKSGELTDADQQRNDQIQHYFSLAAQAQLPQRNDYLMEAAAIMLQGNRTSQAAKTLKSVNPGQLERYQLFHYYLLTAELAEQQQQPQQALDALAQIDINTLADPADAKHYHQLAITLYQQLDNPAEEAQQRLAIIPYLGEPAEQDTNDQRLLALSLQISQQLAQQLLEMEQPAPSEALIKLISQLRSWINQRKLMAHPAGTQPSLATQPQHLAVLLPLSGRFASAGEAIKQGMLSAHYAEAEAMRPTLSFYDTQGQSQTIGPLLQQVLSDGADFIIGPLTKDAVSQFALLPELPAPMLTLNYASIPVANTLNMYQFGLSPENEASQVAARAWDDGLRHPVLLTPDNDWGQRIAAAFRETWQTLGGEISGEQIYDTRKNDFSQPIRAAFELDLSDQRHHNLQRITGSSLQFQPRRRQDIDFIFVAAQPVQARLLRPQLKFHYARDLPIYSTSHLYEGFSQPSKDRDMNDIIFGDSPWTLEPTGHPLRQQIQQIWPQAPQQHWRLYALGIDAYRISSMLHNLPYGLSYQGETGRLFITDQRQIFRVLDWAQFSKGVAQKRHDQ